jgi:hypothetical protein
MIPRVVAELAAHRMATNGAVLWRRGGAAIAVRRVGEVTARWRNDAAERDAAAVWRGGGGTRRRRDAAAERRGGGETRRRGDAAAG